MQSRTVAERTYEKRSCLFLWKTIAVGGLGGGSARREQLLSNCRKRVRAESNCRRWLVEEESERRELAIVVVVVRESVTREAFCECQLLRKKNATRKRDCCRYKFCDERALDESVCGCQVTQQKRARRERLRSLLLHKREVAVVIATRAVRRKQLAIVGSCGK